MMDIMELSPKMEADLSECHTSLSTVKKSLPKHSFSPRQTRSQTIRANTPVSEQPQLPQLQIKKTHFKVDEVEKVYLNQKAKVVHKNLETIYEDPIWKKGSTVMMGTSKVKRSIYLDRDFRITLKQKSKSRKMKIKRLGKRMKLLKISDEEFKNKMMRVDNHLHEQNVDISCDNKDCSVEFDGSENEGCKDLKTSEKCEGGISNNKETPNCLV